MTFHARCGSNVLLSNNGKTAEKRNPEDHSDIFVFSSQPLGDRKFTVRIQEDTGYRGVRFYIIGPCKG